MILLFITILTGLNLFLIAALLAWNFPDIKKLFTHIKKSTWVLFLIIFLFGTSLRIITPHYNMMFIDEYWSMEAARNMLISGNAELCQYVGYEQASCTPYHKLTGTPFIFSISFFLFGINNYHAIYTFVVLGSLSILLMFLLAYLLSRREDIALYSSLAFAMYPPYIAWSGSASTITPGIFFLLLTLISFLLYFRTGTYRIYLLAVLSLAYAMQIRPELVLLLPLILVMHLLFDKNLKKMIKDYRFWSTWIVFSLFFISFLLQLKNYITLIMNASLNDKEIVGYTTFNYFEGYSTLISDNLFVLFFLVVLEIMFLKKNSNRKPVLFALFLFLMFSIPTMLGLSAKPLLSALVGIFFLSASGAVRIIDAFKETATKTVAYVIITALLLVISFPYVSPYYNSPTTESHHCFSDAKILETYVPEEIKGVIPENCYVITKESSVLSTTGLKTINTHTALEAPTEMENIYRNAGCLMFYEDLSCYITHATKIITDCASRINFGVHRDSSPVCQEIKETYNAEKYKEFKLGNFTYTFYNLSIPT